MSDQNCTTLDKRIVALYHAYRKDILLATRGGIFHCKFGAKYCLDLARETYAIEQANRKLSKLSVEQQYLDAGYTVLGEVN